jgi:hypothetical protein
MSKEALAALSNIAEDSDEQESPAKRTIRALDDVANGKKPAAPPVSAPSGASIGERALAAPRGFNKGVSSLLGLPVDTALDVWDLAKAGAGVVQGEVTGRAPSEMFDPADRSQYPGSGQYIADRMDDVGASTQIPRPDDLPSRLIYGGSSGIPGALTGGGGVPGLVRQGVAGVASGLTSQVGTELGLDPSTSMAAAMAVGAGFNQREPRRENYVQPDAPEADRVQVGKSAGASAADVNVRQLSPELREVVTQAAKQGELNPESFQRHVEADQLPIPIRLSRGQATQDVRLLSEEQNARAKNPEFAARFQQQNKQLIENLDEVRRETAPTVVGNDHIQNGQTLVDAYKSMDETARADISAKYKALEEANGGEFPVNGQAFVKAADAALSKKMKGRYVPPEVSGDLAELRDGGAMTFETFENLRTNLAAAARKAERSGDGNAASAINIVREHLENLPIEGEAANIKPLADAARSAAKARFDRIKSDPAYKAATEDAVGAGESSPLADNFVERYVVKGKGAHIKKMREHLAGDDVAQETIAAGALNYLKNKAGVDAYTNEGNFSQAGYNKALNELLPKMNDLVPGETAETLQRIGATARATQAQPRGSYVNNSNTFVSQLGNHAANVLEGMANVKAGGIPVGTFVRKKLGGRSEKKFVEESLKPGAGLALKEVLDPKAKKKK